MNAQRSPWADRNFRWLMAGGMLSMVGDQFTLIALPWLVLQLTGDPLALGLVVALMGIPRAVFILVGGAIVDRHSPKHVMMWSKHASTVLLGVLAALTLAGNATLPVVYALALAIGPAQAFGIPSGTAMLPRSVQAPLLQAANAAMMGMRQLSMLAGPLLAALLLVGDGIAGLLLAPLGGIDAMWQAIALLLPLGVISGFRRWPSSRGYSAALRPRCWAGR